MPDKNTGSETVACATADKPCQKNEILTDSNTDWIFSDRCF